MGPEHAPVTVPNTGESGTGSGANGGGSTFGRGAAETASGGHSTAGSGNASTAHRPANPSGNRP